MEYQKKIKCELYRDSMQNYKSYGIPKAQLIIADVPYCYDEETECWTTDGWKKYTELTTDDTVMSLNHLTQEIEYSGIKNIIIKDKPERMVKFETKDIDLVVTEEHRMYALHKKSTKHNNIKLAKDVNAAYYIPRSGYLFKSHSNIRSITIPECRINKNGQEHIEKSIEISLEKWLPFFGLWIADGCVCNSKGNNGRQLYRVSIKQAGSNRDIVSNMMKDFPLKCNEHKEKRRDESNFDIDSKQLWMYMKQFGKSKEKFIPRWILDLPIQYLELFWEWYVFGDSHKNGSGVCISSTSKQLSEDLQEIALKIGVLCQIRKHTYKTWINPLYEFQLIEIVKI